MRSFGAVLGVVVAVLVLAGVGAVVWIRGGARGGRGGSFRADPFVRAMVDSRLPAVQAVADSLVPQCPARRGTRDAPSPALGTPIVAWPETMFVRAACMFESAPGSGNATGGGFEDYGVDPGLAGSWGVYGPSGWHFGHCTPSSREPCAEFSVFGPDPRYVLLRASRPFPGRDGWAQVEVLLRR